MKRDAIQYTFDPSISMIDVQETLVLARVAIESLHGEAIVRLDARYSVDVERRRCVIDESTDVGRALSRVFTGFALREFGPDAFKLHGVEAGPSEFTAAAARECAAAV